MKHVIFICSIACSLFLLRCSEKQSDIEFEKSVAYEVFPLLIDRIHFDRRLGPPAPPSPSIKEDITFARVSDSILQEWEAKSEELYKDSVKLVIAVKDSTEMISSSDLSFFIQREVDDKLIFPTIEPYKKYLIDLNRIVTDPKLKSKYRSEFPEGSKIWNQKYDFHLSGIVGFSRILFDQSKQYGILSTGLSCGKLCGTQYLVLIKKADGKWQIEKMIVNSEA